MVFDNLTPEQLREIVRHMADDIGARLRSRNIVLIMTDRALDAVVQIVRTRPSGGNPLPLSHSVNMPNAQVILTLGPVLMLILTLMLGLTLLLQLLLALWLTLMLTLMLILSTINPSSPSLRLHSSRGRLSHAAPHH